MPRGRTRFRIAALLATSLPAVAAAQPADLPIAPATTTSFPPGVKLSGKPGDQVYVDRRGLVLYGMDLRTLLRWSPDPAQYCKDACAAEWEPMLAPAGTPVNIRFPRGFGDRPVSRDGAAPAAPAPATAPRPSGPPPLPPGFVQPQSAPDWTVIDGPQGPQWVYKGWHMVFTRRGAAAGSREWEGTQGRSWNTLKYVPPMPTVSAPPGIAARYHDGAYLLADKDRRLLFTGSCRKDCAGWLPLAAPLASRGVGRWQVQRAGDGGQWTLGGKAVFVASEDSPDTIPAGGKAVKP